jgi:EIX receptor 1/2
LSGKIPTGTQLQSFGASSYASNRYLCGLPNLKRCLGDEEPQGPQIANTHREGNIQEHANSNKHLWFYASIAIGFIVGFWGVCGSLVLKNSWRHAYFQFLDKMGDRLYVTYNSYQHGPSVEELQDSMLPRTYLIEVAMLFLISRSPIFK